MFNNLIKSSFVKNVMLVASGTAGAQAITMLFTPIITRLYSPETFGLLGIFISVSAIFFPLASLSYPMAIVLPKKEVEAYYLVKLSFIVTLFISIVISILFFPLSNFLLELVNAEGLKNYIFLIPLTIFFTGVLSIYSQWLIRKKEFKVLAKVNVYQSLIVNLFKTGFGLLNPLAIYLIITTSFSYLLQAILLKELSITYKNIKNKSYLKSKKKLIYIAKKYSDFAIFRTPQNVINSFSQNIPILLLASLFSPASAGLYTIARIALGIPSRLLGQSVSDVFYSRINEASHNKEDITYMIIKATKTLAIIGVLPFGTIILFGPDLFQIVFGDEWYKAGEYARWLAILLFFAFINRPSVASIPTLKIQHLFLYYEVISSSARIIALLIGFYIFKNDLYAVMLFCLTGAVFNFILISYTINKSRGFNTYE